MICVICGTEVDSIEEAVDEGWIPYFYDNQIECGPACPNCSEAHLKIAKTGELESLSGEAKRLAEVMIEHKDQYSSQFENTDQIYGHPECVTKKGKPL